jgi:myo-inositol 2-dehydrogenase / D-chiro-inositol 1-dehydrogenase
MRQAKPKRIGLGIVGAGKIGLARAEIAARFPQVDWIGIAEIDPGRAAFAASRVGADFVTHDYRELFRQPEITAAIIATLGENHVEPTLAALDSPNKIALLIEKPIAIDAAQSLQALAAIREAGVDAVIGYTQRFRRRWLVAKDRIASGALGDISTVSSRAFLNQMVAANNYRRSPHATLNTPMVISGTHVLDLVMWMMEGRTPVEVYARSIDRRFGSCGGADATAGTLVFGDGTLYQSTINWALPVSWPGAVYGIELGVVGTKGAMTVDDTHRDFVLAASEGQGMGHVSDASRLVDFVGSTPAGDVALGALRGPLHEETQSWLTRLCMGVATVHATADEAHERLMLAKAYDLSAKRKAPVALPIAVEDALRG